MTRDKLTQDNVIQLAREAAQRLRHGHAIIYPTDTLYGLGVDALNTEAVEHFFVLKKRPANKPIPLFVSDIKMARTLAFIDKRQEEILRSLWPGPFTCILYKKHDVSSRLSAGTQKVGLRIPNNEFCRILLAQFGGPITSSSANISGQDATDNLDAIVEQFATHSLTPDFVVDAGPLGNSAPSTVLDITGSKPVLLRINQTSADQLKKIFK